MGRWSETPAALHPAPGPMVAHVEVPAFPYSGVSQYTRHVDIDLLVKSLNSGPAESPVQSQCKG